MNKTNNIFKATVVVAIALALIAPGAAMAANMKTLAIKNTQNNTISRDGGWVEQATGFYEASRGISYMHAVDENVVWAAAYDGSGGALPCQDYTMTINGGDEWTPGTVDNADGLEFAMIVTVDENNAWAAMYEAEPGDPQGIYHTGDGGDTWTRQASADFNSGGAFPNVVHFWNENEGWCQGDPVGGYFEMYTTTDGGDTWVRVPQGDIPEPLPGEMGTIGYYDVVGDTVWFGTQSGGRVFKSTDKGYTWTVAETPFASGAYVDIRFKDQNNGLAMDKNFEFAEIAETSDGGETWTMITYSGVCYGADFDYVPGTDNMYVSTGVNSGDPMWMGASYSVDGGHTWTAWDEMSGTQLFGTTWVEGTIGWAGNFNQDEFNGGMYKYTPGELEPEFDITFNDESGLTATIKNVGLGPATDVNWTIVIDGGLIIRPAREFSGTGATFEPGDVIDVLMELKGIGLGIITAMPKATVTVDCAEEVSAEDSAEFRLFFSRVTLQ